MKIYNGTIDCAAEEIGYDSSRIKAVNDFFIRMIEKKIIFGVSYRLARRGKIFAAHSIGSRHYKDADSHMQPNTIYGLASQAKMFKAVAIHMLAEDGLVSIDEPVAKYLPQFDGAPYNDITLLHLLTHTSGLYPEGSIADKHHVNAWQHIEREFEKSGSSTDWIAAGLRGGMRRRPGEEWQYCSFGITILAAIVEKVTGEKFEKFATEKIFSPLGMKNTTFGLPPEQTDAVLVFDKHYEEYLNEIKSGKKSEGNMWDIMPSSDIFSTTEDMTRFAMMLQNKGRLGSARILGRKSLEIIATQRLHNVPDFCWGANEKDRKYGLGFDMRRFPTTLYSAGTLLHEGAGHSVTIIDPTEEMVCSCVYPWVNDWDAECNSRLYNVMWSGLV
jgi:CubicO group peptidase (beta-lactamase class C family)